VVEKKLSNGITLLMLDRGYAPAMAFVISFRVGSVDESYRTIGAAHLLEHMLFKGTENIGTRDYRKERVILRRIEALGETIDRLRLASPGKARISELEKEMKGLQKELRKYVLSSPYDRIYTENGGVGFNAGTSKDKTGYFVELPSSRLELWARIESERLLKPVLREYYLERNNVVQERLMRYDSVGSGSLYERFLATAFIAHPYRHPIIGWRSNIPYLSIRDIRKFYYRYYIPSRMTITIIGKQDTDKTYEVINKYFSRIRSRPDPAEIAVKEPPQQGERRFSMRFEANPYIIIGWHKPTFPSEDDFTCDIVSEMLTKGKSSRLYRSLVLEKKIASSVESWNGGPGSRYNNLFMLFVTPRQGAAAEQVEAEIYREMDRFFTDVTEEELQKVINQIESDLVFGLSRNKGIAHMLSYYQTVFGDWRYVSRYLKNIRKVSIGDIKNMKRKYFKPENRTVGILVDSREDGDKK
jgi:predicted Zn-dependent peptidase